MPNLPDKDLPKKTPPSESKQPVLQVDAGTLVFLIAALILLPLLLTGFFAQ